jgi:hypothetical protein
MSVPNPVFVIYHKPRTKNKKYVSSYDDETSSICGLCPTQPSIRPCNSRAGALDPTPNDVVKPSAPHPRIPEALARAELLVLGAPVNGGGGGLRGCLDSGRDGILVLVLGHLLDREFRELEAEYVDFGDVETYGFVASAAGLLSAIVVAGGVMMCLGGSWGFVRRLEDWRKRHVWSVVVVLMVRREPNGLQNI